MSPLNFKIFLEFSTFLTAWKVPNTEFFLVRIFPHSVNLRIQSECGKIWTRKISYLNTFHAVSEILSLKLFEKSRGNFQFQFQAITIQFRFNCGEWRLCHKVKNCQSILWKVPQKFLLLSMHQRQKKQTDIWQVYFEYK